MDSNCSQSIHVQLTLQSLIQMKINSHIINKPSTSLQNKDDLKFVTDHLAEYLADNSADYWEKEFDDKELKMLVESMMKWKDGGMVKERRERKEEGKKEVVKKEEIKEQKRMDDNEGDEDNEDYEDEDEDDVIIYPYDNRKLEVPEAWRNPLTLDFYKDFEASYKVKIDRPKEQDNRKFYEEENERKIIERSLINDKNRTNDFLPNHENKILKQTNNLNQKDQIKIEKDRNFNKTDRLSSKPDKKINQEPFAYEQEETKDSPFDESGFQTAKSLLKKSSDNDKHNTQLKSSIPEPYPTQEPISKSQIIPISEETKNTDLSIIFPIPQHPPSKRSSSDSSSCVSDDSSSSPPLSEIYGYLPNQILEDHSFSTHLSKFSESLSTLPNSDSILEPDDIDTILLQNISSFAFFEIVKMTLKIRKFIKSLKKTNGMAFLLEKEGKHVLACTLGKEKIENSLNEGFHFDVIKVNLDEWCGEDAAEQIKCVDCVVGEIVDEEE